MKSNQRPDGDAARHFGLYPAIVTKIVDEDNLGRVEVRFPWLGQSGNDEVRAWATLLTPYAGDGQGLQILPEVDSQVVVGFEAGDLRRPYIVGACWNGAAHMPEDPAEANNKRVLKTRGGSVLEFDDTQGAPKITIKTSGGHQIVLDDSGMEVTITHSSGMKVSLEASGGVSIQANSTVDITASAVNVHAATATFDGIINCATLVASAAVSAPSYTPGAGNIW